MIFKNTAIWLATLILIITTESCTTYPMPNHLRNHFTFHYTPDKSNLDSLIHIQGHYTSRKIYNHRVPRGFFKVTWESHPDTFYMNYIFFDDGIVLENAFGHDQSRGPNDLNYVQSSPEELSRHLHLMAKDTSGTKKLTGTWGSYITSGDTIKIQTIHPSMSLNDGWTGWEKHFKVVDKSTIQQIYLKPLHHVPDNSIYTEEYYHNLIQNEKPLQFVPAKAIPKSKNWLMNNKWFWKSEKAYYEYKNGSQ